MRDVLVVVDMQNDFVSGTLGTKDAAGIVSNVSSRIANGISKGETVIFTRDTHTQDYLDSQEGKNLPVKHCVEGSWGFEIVSELDGYTTGRDIINKPTFGSCELGKKLCEMNDSGPIGKVTLIGLCTDICVISNALLVKAFLPETPVVVDASCCAGVTPESHTNALNAMKCCQIIIENE